MKKLDEKGFVFLDSNNRPFRCCMWNGKPWLFYWHDHDKCWYSHRTVTQMDIWTFPRNLTQEQQDMYNKLHDERMKDLMPALPYESTED